MCQSILVCSIMYSRKNVENSRNRMHPCRTQFHELKGALCYYLYSTTCIFLCFYDFEDVIQIVTFHCLPQAFMPDSITGVCKIHRFKNGDQMSETNYRQQASEIKETMFEKLTWRHQIINVKNITSQLNDNWAWSRASFPGIHHKQAE